ncbi:hypothetical protein N0V85_008517 [Neurospora sp. IMI 360204]|nr:hypothetical protein N0V85_008517 [Neurospora sp. IMI 360204]
MSPPKHSLPIAHWAAILQQARIELELLSGKTFTLPDEVPWSVVVKKKGKKGKKKDRKNIGKRPAPDKSRSSPSIHESLEGSVTWHSREVMKRRTEWHGRAKKRRAYTYTPLRPEDFDIYEDTKALSKAEKHWIIGGHRFHEQRELETIPEKSKLSLTKPRLPRVDPIPRQQLGPVAVVPAPISTGKSLWSQVAAKPKPAVPKVPVKPQSFTKVSVKSPVKKPVTKPAAVPEVPAKAPVTIKKKKSQTLGHPATKVSPVSAATPKRPKLPVDSTLRRQGSVPVDTEESAPAPTKTLSWSQVAAKPAVPEAQRSRSITGDQASRQAEEEEVTNIGPRHLTLRCAWCARLWAGFTRRTDNVPFEMAGGLVFTGMPRRREVLGTGIIRWTKVVNPDGTVTWQEAQPTASVVNSKKEEKGTKVEKPSLERPSWIESKKESNVRVTNKRLAHEVEDLEQKEGKVEAQPTRAFSFRTEEEKKTEERAEKTIGVEQVRFDASVRVDDKKKNYFVAGLASKLDRTAEQSVCPKKEGTKKKEKVETQPAHPEFNPPKEEQKNANAEPLRSHWSKQEDMDNKQESDAELAQRLANTEKIFRQQEQKIQAALDRIRDLEKQLASGFANSTSSTESDEVQSQSKTWDNESIAAGGRESGPHFRHTSISAKGPLPCLSDHNYRVLTVNSNKPQLHVCAAAQSQQSQSLPQTAPCSSPLRRIQLQKASPKNRTPAHPDPGGAIMLAETQAASAEDVAQVVKVE